MLKKLISVLYLLIPLFAIFLIFIKPLLGKGLIVGGDWNFPYTHQELKVFEEKGLSLWSNREIPLGTSLVHNNVYLFQLFAGIVYLLGGDGVSFQIISIFLILGLLYLSSYFFLNSATGNRLSACMGALIYTFSPVVFNYYIMGWLFVILFMAIIPIFTYLTIDFINRGRRFSLFCLGILSSLSLLQSQAIFWIPILFILTALSQLLTSPPKVVIKRVFLGLFFIGCITFAVHMTWIIPSFMQKESLVSMSTPSNDLKRFSAVDTLFNQLRGWGSLFNEQYELSFPTSVRFFTYSCIVVVIYLLLKNKNKKDSPLITLIALLVLLSPTLYLLRAPIGHLPFSIIIRDISRFIIFTVFGFSLAFSIFFSQLRSIFVRVVLITVFFVIAYPFLQGRLFRPQSISYGNSQYGKDQRIRTLKLGKTSSEEIASRLSSGTNIFFPTGGSLLSLNDESNNKPFTEVSDIDANYSPFGTGVLLNDKSSYIVNQFANHFLDFIVNDKEKFAIFARVYGVNNIILRSDLKLSSKQEVNSDFVYKTCQSSGLTQSWEISAVCPLSNSFPEIFAVSNPTFQDSPSLDSVLSYASTNTGLVAIIGCPKDILPDDRSICAQDFQFRASKNPPHIKFSKVSPTKYIVEVDASFDSDYVLVLNQSFNHGWILTNLDGKRTTFKKVLVNLYVNGWLINKDNRGEDKFILQYYPQQMFDKLLPLSIGFFLLILVFTLIIYLKNHLPHD